METLDRMPFTKSKVFERLAKIADVRSLTEEEKFQYDESLKHYRDSNAVLRTAVEDGFEEGRAQGHAEGEAIGIEKGRAEGETIGEKKKSLEIARNLKKMGMPIDTIIQATNLTAEEIQNL
ncbi:MAG: transposase [Prevotella sp.]|nr:transposase [Prevotella sp.]